MEDIKDGEFATDLIEVADEAIEVVFLVAACESTVLLIVDFGTVSDLVCDCDEGETGTVSLDSAFFFRLVFFFFFLAGAATLSSSPLASSTILFGAVATMANIQEDP